MVSFLEGQLKAAIAKGFKGRLSIGTIRRSAPASLDDFGDVTVGDPTDYAFEGTRDSMSAKWLAAGVPVTDVQILVLLGSTSVEPKQDDKIKIKGSWYQVRQVLAVDPANATSLLAAFLISDQ